MKKILPLAITCFMFALKSFSTTHIVTVQNFSFSPSGFTVNIGDTVRFVWGSGSHTTTSISVPAGAAAWDHPMNSSSTTFTYVPSKIGEYDFKCTPHFAMGMKGSFTVVCPNATVQIAANGGTVVCKGNTVLLSSTANSSITSYQWKKNGKNISNATNATFAAAATGSYTVKVVNTCGKAATSNAINVTVNALPVAKITPADTVFICSGGSIKLSATAAVSQTYVWKRNGVVIAGATSRNYTATKAGNYKVVVTKTTTGCSSTSPSTTVIINCSPAIAATLSNKDIKIYPNPSANNFHISLPANVKEYSVFVFDEEGKLIGSKAIVSKDFSFGDDLKAGVYFVEIKNNGNVIAREKVVKQ